MDEYWWEDFRKRYMTPFFKEIRRRTNVFGSCKTFPCCHFHALDYFDRITDNMDISVHGGVPIERLPIIAFTHQDIHRYRKIGEMYVILYETNGYERILIESIAILHKLSFQYVTSFSDPKITICVVAKKYHLRPHVKKLFFAICRIRIFLNRVVNKLYRPPDGAIFKKWLQQSVNILPIQDFQNFQPN